jgi:hypothetical protein
MEQTQDRTEATKQARMEWGIFLKSDVTTDVPSENRTYVTREAAEKTRKRSFVHPERFEVRGREVGPWDVRARG